VFAQPALASGLLALALVAGCAKAGAVTDDWVPVIEGDLVLEVDVVGTMRATRSAPLSPPGDSDDRDFKIARMLPEGTAVKKGQPALWFDASEMERDLVERRADVEEAAKEVERKAQDIELDRKQGDLRLVEAEAKARKARLKADLPPQYTSAVEVKLAKIDLESAEAELRMAKQRLEHSNKLNLAELAYLRDRHARFKGRLDRLEGAIAKMVVSAPIDGVVVYRSTWRGEKKKVGDPCWVGEACIEVTDTREMEARGEVDELESARVRVGQPVRVRLEALPETEWAGKVESLRPNVYRQSPRTPIKVIGVNIALEKLDASRMRPGMQFRGRLETGKVAGVVLAPLGAVFMRSDGPVVFRRTATGFDKVKVVLGQRSRVQVEVKSGLQAGDRVARRDLEEAS
jgi:multidrug efflux pump subunit AcrA (membrane-fusion protein)